MTTLSRDAILNAKDLKVVKVEVPEWGGDVCIRVMSGKEKDAFDALTRLDDESGKRDPENFRARLLVEVLCDEAKTPLFRRADVDALGEKATSVLERLFGIALDLNGMSAKSAEAMEKNFAVIPTGDSGSGSA